VADEDLYALPPEEFTAARDAAAKAARAAGDKEGAKTLAGLRRPTVSAHLVNLLVRAEPALVAQLLDLGAQLGEAQRSGSGDALRALGDQRRALVQAVTDRAVALSDREVATSARTEVEATLEAALADPGAADAVRSGRLVRALSFAGFGGADLEGAVAPAPAAEQAPAEPATGRRSAEARRRAAEQLREAERTAQEAAGRLDDAVHAHRQAARAAERAARDRERADDAVTQAEQALTAARTERERAAATEEEATGRASDAEQAVRSAQDEADAARTALDALRRG
jgi:hypothetical protein